MNEARRAIAEGGAYVNNERVTDPEASIDPATLLHGRYLVLRRGRKTIAGVEVADAGSRAAPAHRQRLGAWYPSAPTRPRRLDGRARSRHGDFARHATAEARSAPGARASAHVRSPARRRAWTHW